MQTDIVKPATAEPSAERRFAGAHGSAADAMLASEWLVAITGPCGHHIPMEHAVTKALNGYCCPVCNLRWRVEQDPPKIYPSGFIMPGDKHIVIEARPPNAKAQRLPSKRSSSGKETQ